ncbi:TetR/AcrR family transcriptional regulator [Goodfellowiella coeruleoviolacea]|uniref:Transcriptional regulator, TetR family n=1 Tax=Goodfellowiella coeruleoviolacea TaxID=334858 RepID=A0AAE3GCW1_9PSEU|nr:TetR/AcrR family transcriptional regulator [Goodfellowiella coeruleoviolacea]MCP2165054.1 transcriptional regulator, TetR family [Goodfellowiella coeruleoviolacea]
MAAEDAGADPGSVDPTRALDLLWGPAPQPSRGPRRGLTLDQVVRAAVEVADAEGLAALSMRRVAAQLGVGTTSLYTYVPGKTELFALMLDHIVGVGPLPHTLPGGWREQFEAWAREDWVEFRRHPWTIQLASMRLAPGPHQLAWFDSALRVLADTGLSEHDMAAVVGSVDGYVRGLARQAVDASEIEARTGVSDAAWDAAYEPHLVKYVDFSRYPMLLRVARADAFPTAESTFEFGLRRMLDGVEAFIAERAAR